MLKKTICTIMLGLICASAVRAQQQEYTNNIGMKFVLIQPGTMVVGKFQPPYPVPDDTVKNAKRPLNMHMGEGAYSTEEFRLSRELAERDARPGFPVKIERAYYMGKFEVTQEQWKKVMGSNPSTFQGEGISDAGNHPVENVSWNDVQRFIAKLNKLEKRNVYRLPSEFEWEYAARAGAENDIAWSDIQLTAHLGTKTTQAIGLKKPNAWGLYDMLGNVWEWVNDPYNEKLFADPVPSEKGKQHVLKGASFTGDVKNATYMTHAGGPGNGWDVGFRIVMMIDKK